MKGLNKRKLAIMTTIILVAAAAVTAIPFTLGILISKPDPLVNTFTDPYVPPSITETFDGETKEEIQIKNVGNTDAFIRLALVIQAKAEDGTTWAYAPVLGTDYSMSAMDTDWFLKGDYYYYKYPVPPGGLTSVLFSEIKALKIPLLKADGIAYYLNVDVVAQSIQARPLDAVEEAWPVTASPGTGLAP